jgi:CBS domain containing-hemolysin-like protein
VPALFQYALAAMGVLILCCAFFSASEAALFYLSRPERHKLAAGNRPQRMAAKLLAEPDRLMSAVLFCNLVVNLAYFALASIISIRLNLEHRTALAGSLAFGSLLALIVFGEMLPKSLAVLQPARLAALVSLPLAATVRILSPLLPGFHLANLLSRRLLLPRFRPEPYLRVGDLERAVRLSTSDAALLGQEQRVLQNLVLLSEIRAEELMRPRVHFFSFRPPVSLADLKGQIPRSGYLLVTEPDSDEVASAIPLRSLWQIPGERLEDHAEAVVYVPWCTTVAEVLEVMQRQDRQVAAVLNEFGETIGILTFDDVLDTIFSRSPSRSQRLLQRMPIRRVSTSVWHVTGMTSLWRLVRHFNVERPASKSVTVAGVVQEVLERLPQPGDQCRWGPFQLQVLDVPERGQLLVELTLSDAQQETG